MNDVLKIDRNILCDTRMTFMSLAFMSSECGRKKLGKTSLSFDSTPEYDSCGAGV